MSVFWLSPAALFGLALMALPIAIHLLVRQQSRRVEYPSLRFLQPSQLAAFRRRNIQDALLLACRAAILAVAVMALAGPVFQTPSRTAGYAGRVARAVIVEPGAAPEVAAAAAGDAFVFQAFTRGQVSDAIADAARWLGSQPPAAREVVFAGALRRGSVSAGQLSAIPPFVGIRFVATPGAVPRDSVLRVLKSGDGGVFLHERQVRLDDDETTVSEGVATPAAADIVRIVAASPDQPLADAALRAALAAGLRWTDPAVSVLVAWAGAGDGEVERLRKGATLVRMERPSPASTAATAVSESIEAVTAASREGTEPVRIGAEQLQAWTRPPGPVPGDARPADEGDRRWLWGLALVLLAAEHWLRRARTSSAAVESGAEVRVA